MKSILIVTAVALSPLALYAQNSVGLTGTALSPTFSPGGSFPIVRISVDGINLSPIIDNITVTRTGSATDSDVPTVKLYRDLDTNDVVDDPTDIQVGATQSFTTGSATFSSLNYIPTQLENLLVVFDVDPFATTTNTCGASMSSSDIGGAVGTTVTFTGVTTLNQPLPVQLVSFSVNMIGSSVVLEWQTATETDNYGFEVKRRPLNRDASVWAVVGFIQGSGTSQAARSYAFEDRDVPPGKHAYKIVQIDRSGGRTQSFSLEIDIEIPANLIVYGNYPNPFNPVTTIDFFLPEDSEISLDIIDTQGRQVSSVLDTVHRGAGRHKVAFDATELVSGTYFYRIKSRNTIITKKMILLK